MKLLRNPIVVGVLSVVAVGLVLWSSLGGKRGRVKVVRTAAATPAVAPAPAELPAETPAAHSFTNLVPIETAYVRGHQREWAEAPRRDPFALRMAVYRPEGATNAPLVAVLNAVWRQGYGFLAVVNQRVVQEGDSVGEHTVHRIEDDRVLFRGPNGVEEIAFKTHPGELPQESFEDFAGSRIRKH